MKKTTTTKSKQKAARAAFFFCAQACVTGLAIFFSATSHGEMKMKMSEPKNASRPMSEMEGGCDNFKMPVKKELALWDKKDLRVQGAQDDKSTTELPSDRRVVLTLYPQKKVAMVVKPEKEVAKGQIAYAGLAAMEVKKDGLYRVAMGSKVWLDLIEIDANENDAPAKTVNATTFEMQTGCAKIFKAVEYDLRAGKKYLLQISASPAESVQVLTTFTK